MRKLVIALILAGLLALATVTPALAAIRVQDERDNICYDGMQVEPGPPFDTVTVPDESCLNAATHKALQ